jgi:putative flavoprotein involved in K+ transport
LRFAHSCRSVNRIHVDTIVIGAGQAGLATSYFLTSHGREHLVLERGRVGETWRAKRWDGFYLNTPNWAQQLPGRPYSGPDPDAFAPLADVIAYLDEYATSFEAPVRTGVDVSRLAARGDGWLVEANGDVFEARNVVVATGAYQRPTPAALADDVPGWIFQLHTSEYRNPEQLPAGAVLIVGSGQSGCQIADELMQAGRTVFLSVGRCGWAPRRYRGREMVGWFIDIGFLDQTVDTLPDRAARLTCNVPISGNDGGHDCHPTWLAQRGARLLGRVIGFRGATVSIAGDLAENVAKGNELPAMLTRKIDEYVESAGLHVPGEELELRTVAGPQPEELDLRSEEIGTVLWATGYRPDFGWIDLPFFDEHGWPVQERGVTASRGLYFVGLHWLHKRKSSLFLGVGEDAEHVVSHIDAAQPG